MSAPEQRCVGTLWTCPQRAGTDRGRYPCLSGRLLQSHGQYNWETDENREYILDPLVLHELASETHTDEGKAGAVMAENAEKTTIGPILMLR